ncbi:MAG: hypothetical protein P8046_15585, partial [Anaerolineales bacterium]
MSHNYHPHLCNNHKSGTNKIVPQVINKRKFLPILFSLSFLLLISACGQQLATLSPTANIPTNTLITPEPIASETPIEYPTLSLKKVESGVLAFPGPDHYEGDLLSLQINTGASIGADEQVEVTLQLDQQEPFKSTGTWQGYYLYVLFETTGITGDHSLAIHAEK